jgi:hypothetical protein
MEKLHVFICAHKHTGISLCQLHDSGSPKGLSIQNLENPRYKLLSMRHVWPRQSYSEVVLRAASMFGNAASEKESSWRNRSINVWLMVVCIWRIHKIHACSAVLQRPFLPFPHCHSSSWCGGCCSVTPKPTAGSSCPWLQSSWAFRPKTEWSIGAHQVADYLRPWVTIKTAS